MIIGTHSIIYTKDPEADRKFFKKLFKLPSVDTGDGWLIFGLPDSEVAFHPSSKNDKHEFYLLCDDINAFIQQMKKANVKCSKVQTQPWGHLTSITLPGGGKIGVYQALHKRPRNPTHSSKSRITMAKRSR